MSTAQNVALVMNHNARRVSDRVVNRLHDLMPPEQVYATRSPEETRAVVREILDRGYDTVFAGGGDGTFIRLINSLAEEAPQGPWPRLGLLPLGTGNAIAELVSTGTPEGDLRAFLTSEGTDDVPLSLIRDDEGTLFPFGGLGWDARILNDYDRLKKAPPTGLLSPLVRNTAGYFAAAFTRSIPSILRDQRQHGPLRVTLTATGDQAFSLGENGVVHQYFEPGSVLYDGPAALVLAGTTPYFGAGMKILPFAGRYPSMMHIRVVNVGVARALKILPEIWKGTYSGPELVDFAVEGVDVTLSRPTPYQVAGDAAGVRDGLRLEVAPQPVRLIRMI